MQHAAEEGCLVGCWQVQPRASCHQLRLQQQKQQQQGQQQA
jgi:hypothetical protein